MSNPFSSKNISNNPKISKVMKDEVVFEENNDFEEIEFRSTSFPTVKHDIFLGKKESSLKTTKKNLKKKKLFSKEDIIEEKIKLQKIEWMLPKEEEKDEKKKFNIRFDFNGRIITEEDKSNKNLHTSEFFHHSKDSNEPGYTFEEILMYIRSKVTSSQLVFLNLFSRLVLFQTENNYSFFLDKIRDKFQKLNLFTLFSQILFNNLKNKQVVDCIVKIFYDFFFSKSYVSVMGSLKELVPRVVPFINVKMENYEKEALKDFFGICIEKVMPMYKQLKLFDIFKIFHQILCENDVRLLYAVSPLKTVDLIVEIYNYNNSKNYSKNFNGLIRNNLVNWLQKKVDFNYSILFFYKIDCSLIIECVRSKISNISENENEIVLLLNVLCNYTVTESKVTDKISNFIIDEIKSLFSTEKLMNSVLLLFINVVEEYKKKKEFKILGIIKNKLNEQSEKIQKKFLSCLEILQKLSNELEQISFSSEDCARFISPQWFLKNKIKLESFFIKISLLTSILKSNRDLFDSKLLKNVNYDELLSLFFKFCFKFRFVCNIKLRKLCVVLLHEFGLILQTIYPQNVDLNLLLVYTCLRPRGLKVFNSFFNEICSINQEELEKYLKEFLFENSSTLDIDWFYFIIEKKYLNKMKITSKLLEKSLKFINYVEKNCVEYLRFIPSYIRLVNVMKVFLFDCNFWEEKMVEKELFEFVSNYLRNYFNQKIVFLNEKDDEDYFLSFLNDFIAQFCSVSFLNEVFTYFLLIFFGNQWGERIKGFLVETMKNKVEKYMIIKNNDIRDLFIKNNYVIPKGESKRQSLVEKIVLDLFDSEENSISFKNNNLFMYNIFLDELKQFKIETPENTCNFVFKSLDLNNFIGKEIEK